MDLRRVLFKQRKNFFRVFAVEAAPVGEKNSLRAKFFCLKSRHRRMDAVLSRFVGGGGYDTLAAFSTDDHRLAFQRGIYRLLYGSVKCVHIDMKKPGHKMIIGSSRPLVFRLLRRRKRPTAE